eukprot:8521662-Heterocapsa_arctica.AAC.1
MACGTMTIVLKDIWVHKGDYCAFVQSVRVERNQLEHKWLDLDWCAEERVKHFGEAYPVNTQRPREPSFVASTNNTTSTRETISSPSMQ